MAHLLDTSAPPLADGVRSSTSCVARQYREFIDRSLYPDFPKGLGQAGHDAGDKFGERHLNGRKQYAYNPVTKSWAFKGWEFPDRDVTAEYPIVWEHGTSHVDFVDFTNHVCHEVKSVGKCAWCPYIKDAPVSTRPKTEQRRQLERQYRHAVRAGLDIAEFTWQIDIVCRNCTAHFGPYPLIVLEERLHDIDADVVALDAWLKTGVDVMDQRLADACSCGTCRKQIAEHNAGVAA